MKKKILFAAIVVLASYGAYRFFPKAWAAGDDEPICVVTHIDLGGPSARSGGELLRKFVSDSRNDPGAVRIELFEQLSRTNHLTFVEIWKDRASYEEHLLSPHTKAYRSKLQPMLASQTFDERLHRESK